MSELSAALKRTVEGTFDHLRVRGEISGFKRVASGHCYFTLKDDSACIDAVIWRGGAGSLRFQPEDGIEVIATGRLTTYPARSRYQIVVERLELAGQGALMALLEKRRLALAGEGLFDEGRKRRLPFAPRRIGVVTSPTGAVIRDILHRLEDRFPTHVLLWPVPVQGEGAAEKVAAAITGFAALPEPPELIIVARGGGSIEDLWAFNEGGSARSRLAIRSSPPSGMRRHHLGRCRRPTGARDADRRGRDGVRGASCGPVRELGTRDERCRRPRGREGEQLRRCFAMAGARALLAPQRQRLDELAEQPRALVGRLDRARGKLGGRGALRPALLSRE